MLNPSVSSNLRCAALLGCSLHIALGIIPSLSPPVSCCHPPTFSSNFNHTHFNKIIWPTLLPTGICDGILVGYLLGIFFRIPFWIPSFGICIFGVSLWNFSVSSSLPAHFVDTLRNLLNPPYNITSSTMIWYYPITIPHTRPIPPPPAHILGLYAIPAIFQPSFSFFLHWLESAVFLENGPELCHNSPVVSCNVYAPQELGEG